MDFFFDMLRVEKATKAKPKPKPKSSSMPRSTSTSAPTRSTSAPASPTSTTAPPSNLRPDLPPRKPIGEKFKETARAAGESLKRAKRKAADGSKRACAPIASEADGEADSVAGAMVTLRTAFRVGKILRRCDAVSVVAFTFGASEKSS